jgi:hypothetical protein
MLVDARANWDEERANSRESKRARSAAVWPPKREISLMVFLLEASDTLFVMNCSYEVTPLPSCEKERK